MCVCKIIISPYLLRHWLRLNDDKRLYYKRGIVAVPLLSGVLFFQCTLNVRVVLLYLNLRV